MNEKLKWLYGRREEEDDGKAEKKYCMRWRWEMGDG
jgi:hypothetical protein